MGQELLAIKPVGLVRPMLSLRFHQSTYTGLAAVIEMRRVTIMAKGKYKKFYNSKAWKDTRLRQLKLYPLCAACFVGRTHTTATCVDHKIAIAVGGHPLDPENLESLCHRCHSKKTVRRDGGFGNRYHNEILVDGCSPDGLPLDKNHPWYGAVNDH